MKKELIEVLHIFQQGYVERDCNKIDAFMGKLFDKDEDVVVVGTSSGEWCLGYEDIKDLFLSDWEDWGDVRINFDKANIMEFGNTALIYTPGTVKYSFNSKSETYTRYLGYIKDYFNEDSDHNKKTDKIKLTEINWTLSHLLTQRDTIQRDYLWEVRISFVLIKKDDRWVIKHMQFAFPVDGYLPEVRIDNYSDALDDFNEETKQLEEYREKIQCSYREEILKVLQNFNNEYLDKSKEVGIIASKYFDVNNPLILNADNCIYTNKKGTEEFIENHRACYDEIELDYKNCLVNSNENLVWIVTHGIMKKSISEKESLENTIKTIKSIFINDIEDREKLFRIRRSIAGVFKETAKGEDYVWPFRFEAALSRENGKWVFKYLQFSLPFYYILEGKTDAAKLL